MRDINRIDKFLEKLGELWKENVPDWRFMQLICNLQSAYGSDLFYIEEDKLLEKYLKGYFENVKSQM